MNDDNDRSNTPLPSGTYSTESSQYVASSRSSSTDVATPPADAVRVFARKDNVTITYDARELATQRMIRRINES